GRRGQGTALAGAVATGLSGPQDAAGHCRAPVAQGDGTGAAPLLGAPLARLELSKRDRKSTRLNSSHVAISYAVFCLKKKDAGHELATHYDAMSEGTVWSESAFDEQWRQLVAMFGDQPVTNKNHYTRWEGDV